MMQLLMSPTSPFVRKVRVLLREADLLDRVEEIQVATSPYASNADVIASNPIGKIPALTRPDGPTLYDSRVITRYLDGIASADLYPTEQIWEMLTLEATADAMMEAAVLMAYEVRLRPKEDQSQDWVEAQWAKVDRAIQAISNRWMSHLSGPLNIGQIGVACALCYLDLRHGARDWRNGQSSLADWHQEFAARSSMLQTAPDA